MNSAKIRQSLECFKAYSTHELSENHNDIWLVKCSCRFNLLDSWRTFDLNQCLQFQIFVKFGSKIIDSLPRRLSNLNFFLKTLQCNVFACAHHSKIVNTSHTLHAICNRWLGGTLLNIKSEIRTSRETPATYNTLQKIPYKCKSESEHIYVTGNS